MKLVDTNILVFAINSDSPKQKTAIDFLKKNASLAVAHQNILEAIRVLTHPKFPTPMKPKDAQKTVLYLTRTCKVIYPNFQTFSLALEFIKQFQSRGNKIFDAYLAATALSNGISTIATDNVKDFSHFGIEIVNPFAL